MLPIDRTRECFFLHCAPLFKPHPDRYAFAAADCAKGDYALMLRLAAIDATCGAEQRSAGET